MRKDLSHAGGAILNDASPVGFAPIPVGTDFVQAIGTGLCRAQVAVPLLPGGASVDSGEVASLTLSIPNQPLLVDRELNL